MQGKKFLQLLILVVIPVLIGLYIRFDDLTFWNKHREFFYYEDRPLFTSYDAFFFARFGEDYLEGVYRAGKMDPLRFVPDNFITGNVTYPDPIPMESWIGAQISKTMETHIENVALWLTPVLSVLFVIPLLLYLSRLGLPVTGFSGALLGVISLIYLVRTQIVRFDTDSLNLFFPFAIGYFLFESTLSEGKKKYLFLIVAGLLSQLYNWWYMHPGLVLVIFLTYVVWLFVFSRDKWKENIKNILVLAVFSNPLVIYSGMYNLVSSISTYFINYFKPALEGFPNVFMSISEARHFELLKLSKITAGNMFIFSLGFAGTILLFIRELRSIFFLIPVFLIGAIALKGGNRFGMYIAPFIGMGFGYLLERGIETVKERFSGLKFRSFLYPVGVAFLVVALIVSNWSSFKFISKPKITPQLESDFLKLRSITPEDSWIWTWWDYGTAIEYLGRRAVFHDGQSQTSPKTYFVATAFSAPSPELAHNVITAISNIGATGVKKLLKSGKKPKDIRNMIFSGSFSAPLKHPVYWLFSEDEIGKFMWINFFGTWNFEMKKGLKKFIIPLSCRPRDNSTLVCNRGKFLINLKNGTITQGNFQIPLKSMVIRTDKDLILKPFHRNGNLYLEYVRRGNRSWFFLMEEQPFKSMFNQMYILRKYDENLFDLVYDDFPTMVLYRVKNIRR